MKNLFRIAAPLFICAFSCLGQVLITAKPAEFKDWNFSTNSVFGLVKLTDTAHRSYYKIWKPDAATVKVQTYSASGILTSTTTLRFVNGLLAQLSVTNRWGYTTDTTKFAPGGGVGQFKVTHISEGENAMFPAKSAKYIYKNRMLAEVRYLAADGSPIRDENGVAVIRYKRFVDPARFSLLQEMTFFDDADQPVNSRGWDAQKVVYERDERGNRTSESYFGADGEPLVNRFGGFKMRSKYDEADHLIASTYVGLNDEAANSAYGISTTAYTYENGLATKLVRSDLGGHIVRASAALDGVAIVRYEYDENGNERKRSFFDESDKPMNSPAGYQSISYKYSSDGMLLGLEFFDKTGQPGVDRFGMHRYDYGRDDKGRLSQLAYFDKQGNPMQDRSNQVYMIKYKYDELGRRYSESYWKDANTTMARWNGYHEAVSRFNDDGQTIEALTFDESGKLFVTKDGYSRIVTIYDPAGRISERRYFNDQVPAMTANAFMTKFHLIKFSYDQNGRESEMSYFDNENKAVNAEASFDDKPISVQRVQLMYQGNRVVEELIFTAGSDVPTMKIDCLAHDFIGLSGISLGRKDQ